MGIPLAFPFPAELLGLDETPYPRTEMGIYANEQTSTSSTPDNSTSNVSTTLKSILSENYVHPDVVDAFIAEVGRIDQKGDTDGNLDRGGELATAFTLILPGSEFSKKYGDGVLSVRSVLTRLFSGKDGEERKDSLLISDPNKERLTKNDLWRADGPRLSREVTRCYK